MVSGSDIGYPRVLFTNNSGLSLPASKTKGDSLFQCIPWLDRSGLGDRSAMGIEVVGVERVIDGVGPSFHRNGGGRVKILWLSQSGFDRRFNIIPEVQQ